MSISVSQTWRLEVSCLLWRKTEGRENLTHQQTINSYLIIRGAEVSFSVAARTWLISFCLSHCFCLLPSLSVKRWIGNKRKMWAQGAYKTCVCYCVLLRVLLRVCVLLSWGCNRCRWLKTAALQHTNYTHTHTLSQSDSIIFRVIAVTPHYSTVCNLNIHTERGGLRTAEEP